jgi:hypothetical protein
MGRVPRNRNTGLESLGKAGYPSLDSHEGFLS